MTRHFCSEEKCDMPLPKWNFTTKCDDRMFFTWKGQSIFSLIVFLTANLVVCMDCKIPFCLYDHPANDTNWVGCSACPLWWHDNSKCSVVDDPDTFVCKLCGAEQLYAVFPGILMFFGLNFVDLLLFTDSQFLFEAQITDQTADNVSTVQENTQADLFVKLQQQAVDSYQSTKTIPKFAIQRKETIGKKNKDIRETMCNVYPKLPNQISFKLTTTELPDAFNWETVRDFFTSKQKETDRQSTKFFVGNATTAKRKLLTKILLHDDFTFKWFCPAFVCSRAQSI